MNTIQSDPDSRWTPNRRLRWELPAPANRHAPRPSPGASGEPVAIDLCHLAGPDLEATLEIAAWVISLCERRPTRAQPVRAVQFDLGPDRPGRLLWLDDTGRPP